MVDLTNCTFDGHIYHTRRVMEECLAIKPALIFLWDEPWFGFAAKERGRLSPETASLHHERKRPVSPSSKPSNGTIKS